MSPEISTNRDLQTAEDHNHDLNGPQAVQGNQPVSHQGIPIDTPIPTCPQSAEEKDNVELAELGMLAFNLLPQEQSLLEELEERVESSFLQACEALLEIEHYNRGCLWRAGLWKSFPEYVRHRFGHTRPYTGLMLRAATFNQGIAALGNGTPTLTRESHIRPIVQKIERAEDQQQFWVDYCQEQNVTAANVGELTAKQIKAAVVAHLEDNPNPEPEAPDEEVETEKIKRSCVKLLAKLKTAAAALEEDEIDRKLLELEALLETNN